MVDNWETVWLVENEDIGRFQCWGFNGRWGLNYQGATSLQKWFECYSPIHHHLWVVQKEFLLRCDHKEEVLSVHHLLRRFCSVSWLDMKGKDFLLKITLHKTMILFVSMSHSR